MWRFQFGGWPRTIETMPMLTQGAAFSPVVQLRRMPTGHLGLGAPTAKWLDPFAPSEQPATLILDLSYNAPLAGALEDAIVSIARKTQNGEYGRARLVVCTPDPRLQNVLKGLALLQGLSFFIASSPATIHSAQPAAPVTVTELQSLQILQSLGGVASSTVFAENVGIELTAAGNRLVSLERQGYLHRIKRPGREGDLYLDPRAVEIS